MKNLTYLAAAAWLVSAAPPAPKVSPAAVAPVGRRGRLDAAAELSRRVSRRVRRRGEGLRRLLRPRDEEGRRAGGRGRLRAADGRPGLPDAVPEGRHRRRGLRRVPLPRQRKPPGLPRQRRAAHDRRRRSLPDLVQGLRATTRSTPPSSGPIPNVQIFPGDRGSPRFPRVARRADGGIGYRPDLRAEGRVPRLQGPRQRVRRLRIRRTRPIRGVSIVRVQSRAR